MMERPDEAIERVLAGLREVEPPAGMEQRVLVRAAARVEARRPVWGWVVGLAAMGGVLGAVAVHRAKPVVERPAVVATRGAPTPEVLRSGRNSVRSRGVSETRRPKEPKPETDVGGIPPPPLPLTEQEKLLLRAVRQGHAADLSVLIPEVRAEQAAEGDVEYQDFFAAQAAPTEDEKGETR